MDLPFSIPFYRWLLNEDSSLSLADLSTVAPEVQVTLKRLQKIVRERDEILANPTLDQETKNAKVNRYSFWTSKHCDHELFTKLISFTNRSTDRRFEL